MKRLYFAALSVFMFIGILVAISYAWFINSEFVEPDLSGYTISAYFGGGDGSEEDPFEIKTPRHLYNLAWLQYLGYFNEPGTGTTKNPNASTLTQFSFEICNDLNMSGWNLPPIGTKYNPFIGSLNGNGYTISNLNTTNDFSEFGLRHPNSVSSSTFANAEIIGFIGAVGKIESMNRYAYSVSSEANYITDLILSSSSVTTTTEQTIVGSVAGYVNGTIEDVGVKSPVLHISSEDVVNLDGNQINISDYTVVGYAEEEYTTLKTNKNTLIYNPTTSYSHFTYYGMGDSDNWGGSIDMSSLYTRINSVINSTRLQQYVTNEIDYYNIDGELTSTKVVQTAPSSAHYYKENGSSGAYLTQNTAPTSGGYDYLTGLYKDVVIVETTGTTNGYKLKSPTGYYLNLSSNESGNAVTFSTTLTASNNSNTATVWIHEDKEGGCSISAYNSDEGRRYYLATTDYETLSLNTLDSFTWKYDANYGYYVNYSSTTYYIRYINNKWVVSNQKAYYITDGTNYLTRNGNNITNSTTTASATRWIFENEGTNPSGIIYDESDTSYKLCIYNNALSARTNTTTSWSNNGSTFYNGSNYIIYNNGWTLYQPNQYKINYNGTYLSLNSDGSINNSQTDVDSATNWTFSDVSSYPKGYISTVIDNITYYLSYNNGLVITTNQTTNWQNDGKGIYVTNNNVDYYVQYKNNSWQLSTITLLGYYISYNGYHLYDDAVYFKVDSNNKVYYTYQGTNVYLCINEGGNWLNRTYSFGETTSSSNGYILLKRDNSLTSPLGADISGWISTTTRYLTYSSGWNITTTSTNLTWTEVYDSSIPTMTSYISYSSTASVVRPNMIRESGTTYTYKRTLKEGVPSVFNYIPLNTDSSNVVKETNTGYIMSGGHSGSSGGLTAVDIRVAGNAGSYNYSRIATSYDSDTNKLTNVYTYDATGLRIFDQSNVEETTYSYYASSNTTFTYQKYAISKESMQTTLSQHESAIGGIHFITSLISMDNLITAPSVLINGTTNTDYQMPENSIDFNLKSKGYINFFATLYYPGSTTFFSLYDIKRSADKKTIIAINHIEAIYQNSSDKAEDYVYLYESEDPITHSMYSNGASSLSSNYVKIFDTNWIETPTFTSSQFEASSGGSGYKNNGRYMTKIFYFEIPINAGEYALGSVEDRDGGYLLYLDIGANAAEVDRTTITQEGDTIVSDYRYVNGIQILAANDTFSIDSDSAVAVIPVANYDEYDVTITRTGDVIAFNQALEVNYKGADITLTNGVLTPLDSVTLYRKILKYVDYNRATDKLYYTTIINDGSNNLGYTVNSVSVVDGVTQYTLIADETTTDTVAKTLEYGLLGIDTSSGTPSGTRVTDYTSITITTSTATPAILDYYYVIDTSNKSNISDSFDMVISKQNGTVTVDDFVVENVYQLAGDFITITSTITGDVVVTVTTISGSYTFTINGTTVDSVGDTVTVTN